MGKHQTRPQQDARKLVRLKGKKWYFNFKVAGRWFGDCTEFYEPDLDKAQALAHRVRNDAILGVFNIKKPEAPKRTRPTLAELLAQYWDEIACHFKSSDRVFLQMGTLERIIGARRPFDEIGTAEVSSFVAKRRREPDARYKDRSKAISPATVNRETALLRQVFNWASDIKELPVKTIRWSAEGIKLAEAAPPERELSIEQEIALFAALRPDYHPLFRFALCTGQRFENCYQLKWEQIRWNEKEIVFRVKSKGRKGEEKWHVLPVSDEAVWDILRVCRNHHPSLVFTYVADYTQTHRSGQKFVGGERYPFTKSGWRKIFKAAIVAAGIPRDFRFHDLRHSCAARMRDAGADITDVQMQLGHADIAITKRYFHKSKKRLREAQIRTSMWHSQAVANSTGSPAQLK